VYITFNGIGRWRKKQLVVGGGDPLYDRSREDTGGILFAMTMSTCLYFSCWSLMLLLLTLSHKY